MPATTKYATTHVVMFLISHWYNGLSMIWLVLYFEEKSEIFIRYSYMLRLLILFNDLNAKSLINLQYIHITYEQNRVCVILRMNEDNRNHFDSRKWPDWKIPFPQSSVVSILRFLILQDPILTGYHYSGSCSFDFPFFRFPFFRSLFLPVSILLVPILSIPILLVTIAYTRVVFSGGRGLGDPNSEKIRKIVIKVHNFF